MSAFVCLIPVIAAVVVVIDNPVSALACAGYFMALFLVVAVVFHRKM